MLTKIRSFFNHNRGYIETGKLTIIALLALISLFVSIYVLWESPWTGFRFMYVFIPHLYLIPIILLALWYPKSGLKLIGIILISIIAFAIFADIYGYQFSIAFVLLYTGLDLASIMVLLLYVKDRRLVEAVISDLIERGERKEIIHELRFAGDFDAIITAMNSTNENEREEAVSALSELSDPRIVLPLIRAMEDSSPYVRRSAANALGKSNSSKAVHSLIKALSDDDRYVRESAAEALGHLGNFSIPELIQSLQNKDWRIRAGSIIALRITSEAIPSLDPILLTLVDDSPYVRREAAKTLGRVGDRTIVPYLIQASKDTDAGVRLRAIRALVKLGKKEEFVPVLNRCLHDEDGAVRLRAREELDDISEDI